MQNLVHGVRTFQANIFRPRRELFERLAKGQRPEVLFITCSGSRTGPNLLTRSEPGDVSAPFRARRSLSPARAPTGGVERHEPTPCHRRHAPD